MKGFIIGFITAVLIVLAIFMVADAASIDTAKEAIEESEVAEVFCEFTEAVYDGICED